MVMGSLVFFLLAVGLASLVGIICGVVYNQFPPLTEKHKTFLVSLAVILAIIFMNYYDMGEGFEDSGDACIPYGDCY